MNADGSRPTLQVSHLQTSFMTKAGEVKAVDDVSFSVHPGRVLGLVGESGSGKTVTGFSIMGLVDHPGRIIGGEVRFRGENVVGATEQRWQQLRGNQIAMVFQDPMMTLNPVLRIDTQMIEAIRAHESLNRNEARQRARDALGRVGIPSPDERLKAYPHQFSGGMRQRVSIAIALLNKPDLIIADLGTGALFVNAALAYVLVAVIMAGWGPDGAYAMIGGWRFLGQLIAYSMLIVMPITAVAMRAESLVNTAIVGSQAGLWNIVYQPLGFVLFYIAAMALAFRAPFDLPSAEGELGGGVDAEYTGVRLAVLRLARLTLVVTLASATTVFYLGGWHGPLLPPWAWSLIKTLAVAVSMLLAGRYLPRIREADLMRWCWTLGIPLALLNIIVVGLLVLVVP